MTSLPAAETFLLACAGASSSVSTENDYAGDVATLSQTALKHGLLPLCAPRLHELAANLPVQQAALTSFQQHHAVRAMRLTWELCDIIRELTAQGVAVVSYKGPLLAQMLYDDTTLRQFTDLDLMVAPSDVPRALEILATRGYQRLLNPSPQHEARFIAQDCEYSLVQAAPDQNGTSPRCLDLHWAFTPRFFVARPDVAVMWRRLSPIRLEGQEILTFDAADTLLMLALNASKDFWGRLLAWHDMATLLRQTPAMDWARLWRESTAWHCQRILAVSLLLVHRFCGVSLPEQVLRQMAQDAALPHLAENVVKKINVAAAHPRTIQDFLLPARVLPDWRTQALYYARLGLQPSLEDWEFIALPERWTALYYLTRPVRLLNKYLRQR